MTLTDKYKITAMLPIIASKTRIEKVKSWFNSQTPNIYQLSSIFLLLSMGWTQQINAQACGSCASANCVGVKFYANKPAAQAGIGKVWKYYSSPALFPATGSFTVYTTVRTDANGQVAVMQELQVYGPTNGVVAQAQAVAASRTYGLYSLSDATCSNKIPATIANDGCSTTFNPAWTNLLPNTDYKLALTSNLGVMANGYQYQGFNIRYYNAVRPAGSFAFNCGTASATGNFYANGVGGQVGTLTVPITSATAGAVTVNVSGNGFSGTAAVNLATGQTSISVPLTYDGSGAAGNKTLTVTSTQGTGSCAPIVVVKAQIASFTFNCGAASATGTFTANGTAGQTGTLTVPLSNATAGAATFSVSGNGFTGTLSTTLTAGQASVAIPITYNGSGSAGAHLVSVTSPQGSGSCSANIGVGSPNATFTFNCGTGSVAGNFFANGIANQGGFVTVPLTSVTKEFSTFSVAGAGFTGSLTTKMVAGQTSVVIPITYDGSGAAGTRTLTITSPQGTGSCTINATVTASSTNGAVTFNCPSTASVIGNFVANGTGGQKGIMSINFTTQTAGQVTFTVAGNGFSGSLTMAVALGQTTANMLVTYDGTGTAGNHAVTVTSSQATGTCAMNIPVQSLFTFNCADFNTSSNFVANGQSQTGSLVIPLSNVSAGSASFDVSGGGFTGSVTTTLRDSQRYVVIPVTYDGSGTTGTHAVTVTSSQGSGACAVNVTVKDPALNGCDYIVGQPISVDIHSQNTNIGFTTNYILTDAAGVIKYQTATLPFTGVVVGEYLAYAVNYSGTAPTLTVGTNVSAIGGTCANLSNAFPIKVCAAYQFNCGTSTYTGVFRANGVGGQTGTLSISILNALPLTTTLTVTGAGFTGTTTQTLTAGQTNIDIPITYNGTGASGIVPLTISSTDALGTCSIGVNVIPGPPSIPLAFTCTGAVVDGIFRANGTTQSGSVTLTLSGVTKSTTDFTVTGTNFGGGLINVELTAGQTSISIPVEYNGASPDGIYTITIGSPNSSNTCTVAIPVGIDMTGIAYNDNGAGGGTKNNCIQDGTEGGATLPTGLYVKLKTITGTTASHAVAIDTAGVFAPLGVVSGTYKVFVDNNGTLSDTTSNLPTDWIAPTLTVTITNGVASPALSFCLKYADNDGDGIGDIVDIDDDNDGVLDLVENSCVNPNGATTYPECLADASTSIDWESIGTTLTGGGTFANHLLGNVTVSGTGTSNIRIGTTNNSGTYLNVQNNGHTLTLSWTNPVTSMIIPVGDMDFDENVTFIAAGATFTPVTLGPTDSWTAPNKISGTGNDLNSTPENYSTIRIDAPAGITSLQMVFGTIGLSGTNSILDFCVTSMLNPCTPKDTDGDGIADYRDTDSDGDGCSDAFESGATTNTTANYTFPAPYGTNGLADAKETVADNGTINYTSTYNKAVDSTQVPCISVAGSVYHDNGVGGGTASNCVKDGTEGGATLPAGMYVKLKNITDTFDLQAVPVAANGSFSLVGVKGTFKVFVDNNDGLTDTTTTLPRTWTGTSTWTGTITNGVPTPAFNFCMVSSCTNGTVIDTMYAVNSTGTTINSGTAQGATGAPNTTFYNVNSTGTTNQVILTYGKSFNTGDSIYITAKWRLATTADSIKVDFSTNGVTFTSNVLTVNGFNATGYTTKAFAVPNLPGITGSPKFIRIQGKSATTSMNIDAVRVDTIRCAYSPVSGLAYNDNGAGGGTKNNCTKDGTEGAATLPTGLYAKIKTASGTTASRAAALATDGTFTLVDVADGTYTAFVDNNNTLSDITSTLPTDWTAPTLTVTVTNGVAIPTLSFCLKFADNDGDGIGDTPDIDDDNDGVLDLAENCTFSNPSNLPANPYTGGANLNGTTNAAKSGSASISYANYLGTTTVLYNNVLIIGNHLTQSPDWGHATLTYSSPITNVAYAVNAMEFGVEYVSFEILPPYTGTPVVKYFSSLQNGVLTQTGPTTWQLSSGVNCANSALCGSGGVIQISGAYYTQIRIAGGSTSGGITWNKNVYVHLNDADVQGSCITDIDGDSIPNEFDLDSDGDGCSDALEAGATTSTTPNYTFPAPYGANGLADAKETAVDNGTINYTSTYSQAIDSLVKACPHCSVGTSAPTLSATTITNSCPTTTVNLGTITATNKPVGTVLTWHTAPTPSTANKVADSTAAATGATYYAAFYDPAFDCYTTVSTAVTATATACCATPTVGGTTASTTPSVCGATNSGTITLSGQTGSVVKWQTSINAGSSWTDIANTTTSYSFANAVDAQQYRAVVNSGAGCLDANSSATTITVNTIPAAPTASVSAQPTCSVATGTITVTSPAVAGTTYSIDGSDYSNTTGSFTGVAAGTYSVTAKSSAGCISPATSVTVNAQPPTPSVPTASATAQPTCTVATGTITVTAPTGAGMTYSIDGSNYTNTTGIFTGVAAGTYSVTAKNSQGCASGATSVTINTQPPSPVIPSATVSQPTCGIATGTINVVSPTGVGMTYSINGSTYTNTDGIFTSIAAGTYSVTAKNSNGCISPVASVVVNAQPPTPSVPMATVASQPSCFVATGTIVVSAPTGAGMTYSVDGSNYVATATFTGVAAGTYSVTAKNSQGCTSGATSVTINPQPDIPTAPVATTVQPTCTMAKGTITITAPTGTGITYSNNGSTYTNTTGTFSLVNPGTYNLTAKNSMGCISPATGVIINAQPITPAAPTANITQPTCSTPTATITVTAPAAVGDMTFSIDGTDYSNTTGIFTGVSTGTYSLTAKTGAGCKSPATNLTITSPPATPATPTASVTAQPTCASATGTITVSAPTGAGLTYSINGSTYTNTTGIFTGVAAGTYSVTAKSSGGCVSGATSVAVDPQPEVPVVTSAILTSPTQASCPLGNDGIITVNATGLSLEYSKDSGQTWQASNVFTGLSAGSYKVLVRSTLSNCAVQSNPSVLTIAPFNCKPDAVDEFVIVQRNSFINIAVLLNDTDDHGLNPSSIMLIKNGSKGVGTAITASGQINYVPDLTKFGFDTLKYVICDNGMPILCDTATVYIDIVNTIINQAPVLVRDSVTIPQDTSAVTIGILNNDYDPDGGLRNSTLAISKQPLNGTVSVNTTSGVAIYTPNPSFHGLDSFRYFVCDNALPTAACDSQTVMVRVVPVNHPPIAVNDTVSTPEDTPLTGTVATNDSDTDVPAQTLSFTKIDNTSAHGGAWTLSPTGGFQYTPPTNFNGKDSMQYQVCDNGAPVRCDTAWLFVNVTAANDTPSVIFVPATMPEDSMITVCSTVTDIDAGDDHTVTLCSQPAHGTATRTFNNTTKELCFTYKPANNYHGKDTVCLTVCDNGTPSLCRTVKVPITVTPRPDTPNTVIPPIVTAIDTVVTVCSTIVDPDSTHVFTATICGAPAHGTAIPTVIGDRLCIEYTPELGFPGADEVCIEICDETDLCRQIIVPIIVNDCPVIVDSVQVLNATCPSKRDGQIKIFASGTTSPMEYTIWNGQEWQSSNTFTRLKPGFYFIKARKAGGCFFDYGAVEVTAPANCTEICNDNIDNDGDGLTDLQDELDCNPKAIIIPRGKN